MDIQRIMRLVLQTVACASLLSATFSASAITPSGAVPQPAVASAPKIIAGDSHRIALVIGNSAYTNSPLKNPVNDAKDIATKLRGLGFEVIERNNLQTRQIGGTLREFRSKLTLGAVALVFYAGHGLQIKGDNYLPAVDAEINSEEDVPNQSLAVKQIMDVLDEAKTRLNLVFLDACRNNPYARSFRSADRGLARISAPSGTLISYATRPGSVAADGGGRNGLYTSKLLAQMDSNLQIEQALKRVVTEVKAASQGKQEPWMEGSIEGDFCFAGCTASGGGTQPLPVPVRVKGREEIEQETWESARDSANIGAIHEYLKQYPKGRFVGQARVLIATLKVEPAKPAEPVISSSARSDAESALWAEAQKGNTAEGYQVYLDTHPKGKYIPFAKARIKMLNDAAQAATEQQEQQAWDKAQQENSEASYSLYLKSYPTGRFAGIAIVHNDELKNDITARVEARVWNNANKSNDKYAVEAYLQRYPAGRYIEAASTKLKLIQEDEANKPKLIQKEEADRLARVEAWVWNNANSSNDKYAVEAYLQRYPAGRYIEAASTKLKLIQEEEANRQRGQAKKVQISYVSQGGLTWMPVTFQDTWTNAKTYCANTTIIGLPGWRLPTKEELVALFASNAMNRHGWTLGYTWSSTKSSNGIYYLVSLRNGIIAVDLDRYSFNFNVTCVR